MPENGNGHARKLGTQGACPICAKATVEAFRPFCSKRCADVDLHRWLTGGYTIPVVEDEDEDGADGNAASAVKKPEDPETR